MAHGTEVAKGITSNGTVDMVTSVCYPVIGWDISWHGQLKALIKGVVFMGKTSTQSKDRYNEAAYARFSIRIRKDSSLYDDIEEFMSHNGTSLNYLVTKLLKEHFDRVND